MFQVERWLLESPLVTRHSIATAQVGQSSEPMASYNSLTYGRRQVVLPLPCRLLGVGYLQWHNITIAPGSRGVN